MVLGGGDFCLMQVNAAPAVLQVALPEDRRRAE
jgi:hypothetical protein